MITLPSIAYLYDIFKQHPFVQTDTRKLKAGDIYLALKDPTLMEMNLQKKL